MGKRNSKQSRVGKKGRADIKAGQESREKIQRALARNLISAGTRFREEFGHKKCMVWAEEFTLKYGLKLQFFLHRFFNLEQPPPTVLDI